MAIPLPLVQVRSSKTPVQNWLSCNLVPCSKHLGTDHIENTLLLLLPSCWLLRERVHWTVAQKRPGHIRTSRGRCTTTTLYATICKTWNKWCANQKALYFQRFVRHIVCISAQLMLQDAQMEYCIPLYLIKFTNLICQYTRKCTSQKRRDESFKELEANVYVVRFVFSVQCCLEKTTKIGENLDSGTKLNFFVMFLHIYCRRVTLSHICILFLFAFLVPKRKVTLLLCVYLFRLSVHRVCEEKGKTE
jgi:hypothetical protein